MDFCFELYMFVYVKRMLLRFTKIIKKLITIKHRNRNIAHLYYLVAKFYIYNLGLTCKTTYALIAEVNEYAGLITDIKNTLSFDIKESILKSKLETLMSKVILQLKSYNSKDHTYTLTYADNKLECKSDIKNYTIEISDKLRSKFMYDFKGTLFDETVFITLLHYTLFGTKKETINLSANFIYDNKKITDKISLDVELFASAVNHNLKKYCSVFGYIEKEFGSMQSMFCLNENIWNDNTYFVANPPFDEFIMESMAGLILDVLSKHKQCCFIVIIPDWRPKPGSNYGAYKTHDLLKSNKYLKIEQVMDYAYYDYFNHKHIAIGKTKTITLVLSNFDITLTANDLIKKN